MDRIKIQLVKKSDKDYRVERPTQTGFSSPATHYSEPRIDLNEVLVKNTSATFYVRVADDTFQDFGIVKNDVLIIDKSLTPKNGQLILAILNNDFRVLKISKELSESFEVWGVITYIIKSIL